MVDLVAVEMDASKIARLGNLIAAAGGKAALGISRALNHSGDKARTQMVRVLVPQTGLKRKVIVKALKVNRAFTGGASSAGGSASYVIRSRGGDVALKYFGPRETRPGVSAAPWSKRRVYPGTFLKGGRFPNRTPLRLGGHVFARAGGSRLPIHKAKSGLFIPEEMVSGSSRAAFFASVDASLPDRMVHELMRLLPSGA